MKKDRVKSKFLEALEKTPIIQHACEMCGISRNTFYRWMQEDSEFNFQVSERLGIGVDRVNDYAESNVLNGIREGDPGMTKYWLSARHKAYRRPFAILSKNSAAEQQLDRERAEREMRKAEKEIEKSERQWESLGVKSGSIKHDEPKSEKSDIPAPKQRLQRRRKGSS